MCGIVGLYLKNQVLTEQIGDLFATMLVCMSDRGPDSAGFALYSDEPTVHIVNTTNGDTFPELPEDASIEVPCAISKHGVEPLATRAPEDSIVGLIRQVKAYERLTIEAAVERSPEKAYLALMANPLIPNAATAHALLEVLKTRSHI